MFERVSLTRGAISTVKCAISIEKCSIFYPLVTSIYGKVMGSNSMDKGPTQRDRVSFFTEHKEVHLKNNSKLNV